MAKVAINIATGSIQEEEAIVGIDLGTTNSLVAMVREEDGVRRPIALREIDGLTLVPSIVHFDQQGGDVQVGNEAKKRLIVAPERTIYSVKRLMGRSYNDVRNEASQLAYQILDEDTEALVRVRIGDRFYTPIELSAYILAELKTRAEHVLKTPVTKAVITVPAYFNDAQRQATRDAGKIAGLDVLRIVNEPTAAALAYGMGTSSSEEEKIVAVYDLGGGTFDISILRIAGGIFEVLSTHGDTHLGGDDMDRALMQLLTEKAGAKGETSATGALRLLAEEVKKSLSATEEWQGELSGKSIAVSRSEFENAIAPLVEKTLHSCRSAMADSGITKEDISAVVLVGGSTRVPLVKAEVEKLFDRKPFDELNPDEVVALGAAVQADILAGKTTDMLLLDVTPLSLGIETMGGLMDVLIPRNSKIPSRAGRQYTTQKDGQGSMRISVFQGERDLVQDNRKLAEFNLSGIPAMPAGLPKVEVSFLLDADGILKVSAKELRSGVAQSIDVKPQYGLTDAEVETMLMASLIHAKEDMQMRALVEAQTEAQQMTDVTETFLRKNESLLSAEEKAATEQQLQTLKTAISGSDKNAIQSATEQLNDLTRPFAERVMDAALKDAMRGKKIL